MLTLLLLAYLGVNSVAGRLRIIGGEDTDTNAHPYMVAVTKDNVYRCGGVLVDDNYVLTAAHCVDSGSESNFAIETNNGNREQSVTKYSVEKITRYPSYIGQANNYRDNIAVLKVWTSIPRQSIDMASRSVFTNQACTIMGWGRDANGDLPLQLQQTSGTILSDSDCSSSWGSVYDSTSQICLSSPDSGACNGDSGGPMVCSGVLAGVASFGGVGCDISIPGVYTKITNYYGWIVENMN